jgi:two-component system, OmpR family, osmolarity sensor histidine kinase EnvZ
MVEIKTLQQHSPNKTVTLRTLWERFRKSTSHIDLFTRTFLLLSTLMLASLGAWVLIFLSLEMGPRAAQMSQRIATSVNLTLATLTYTPRQERPALLLTLSQREGLDVYARSGLDSVEPLPNGKYWQRVAKLVRAQLGEETMLAWSINNVPGFWVSFRLDQERYWLAFDRHEIRLTGSLEWLSWCAAALLLSFLGAALGVSYLNRPLAQLARSAQLLSKGISPPALPETGPSELRMLNTSFNRMARELHQADADRALMLAGISHDLRTPLTRMRIEVELSEMAETGRLAIDQDLAQIEHSLAQLMDYARPASLETPQAINLSKLLTEITNRECCLTKQAGGKLTTAITPNVFAQVSPTDIRRIMSNLIENARRYGLNTKGVPELRVALRGYAQALTIEVSDRGPGIPIEDLERVRKPFWRGNTARTGASGTGLGLAIVDRLLQHIGGTLSFREREGGGLTVQIDLFASQTDT